MGGSKHSADAPSRGGLVKAVLRADDSVPSPGPTELAAYNGFNLAMIDGDAAWAWSNVPEPMKCPLDEGTYGLSNGRLSGPWPKVGKLDTALAEWMEYTRSTAALLDLLSSPDPFEPLPEEPRSGMPIFIKDAVYGTRCSTVVAVEASGAGTIVERRFNETAEVIGETHLSFEWALPDRS